MSLNVKKRNVMEQHWYKSIIARRRTLALVVLVIVIAALLLVSQRAITVQVAVPEHNVSITVFGLGTVEARVRSEIGFEVGAALIELNVDHGDLVSKDAVLARLHSAEQKARVAKAEAGVINAEAALKMTQAVIEKARAVLAQRQQTNARQQSLLKRNTVSEEVAAEAQLQESVAVADLAVAMSDVDVARARLADAEGQLDYDNVLLDHHVLSAPYDGIVVKRHRELGDVLNAGDSLFTLVDTATVWVLAYVDESRAGNIRVGQQAEIRLRSLPRIVIPGHVARIDIESDRVNEERRVYVACDQCPETFHLGEQAEVIVTTAELEKATLIPETAIADYDGTSGKIWIVNDHQLHLQTVEFGSKTLDGRVVITAGVASGALVVTEVHSGLRESRRAKVAAQATP